MTVNPAMAPSNLEQLAQMELHIVALTATMQRILEHIEEQQAKKTPHVFPKIVVIHNRLHHVIKTLLCMTKPKKCIRR